MRETGFEWIMLGLCLYLSEQSQSTMSVIQAMYAWERERKRDRQILLLPLCGNGCDIWLCSVSLCATIA